jgi:hypothetical protein
VLGANKEAAEAICLNGPDIGKSLKYGGMPKDEVLRWSHNIVFEKGRTIWIAF